MKFQIKHEMKGRIRVHFMQKRMTYTQADLLQYYLESLDGVTAVKVYDRTADAAIQYQGARTDLLKALQRFHYEAVPGTECGADKFRTGTEQQVSGEAGQ